MKKSAYKFQIKELNIVIANLIDTVVVVSEKTYDLTEAIDRRRKLHESMLELVNRDQPKSMQDMAKVIMDHASKDNGDGYSEDEAMDILLEIIG